MKPSEFNKVFRRLRWDESRRLELEAMLSLPAVQPQKRKKAVTEEVILMSLETRNHSPRSGWRTAAAALGVCAAVGVIVGGIALLGGKEDPLLPQTSLSGQTSQSGNEASGTDTGKSPFAFVEDHVEGDLQTKFEGPDDVPSLTIARGTNTSRKYAAAKLLEGPSGWYCMPFASPQYSSFDEGNLIVYTDAASGADTPLCARPECTHDNEYCTANNSKYAGVPSVYYDGYLYGICADTDKIEVKAPEDGETWFSSDRGDIVLVRYAPDGTELTGLCSLIDAAPDSLQHASFADVEIIGHRGALWIAAKFELTYGVFNDSWGGYTEISENRRGYGLFHYDLDSGKLTPVIYCGLSEELTEATTPYRLSGYGDYVYFQKSNTDWADPYNGDYIYRVDIRTGAVEKVTDQAIAGYGMGGGKLIYLRNYNASTRGEHLQPWVIDLATGEQRMFLGEEDYMVNVQCSDDYVILTVESDSRDGETRIYNWQGELLSVIEPPPKQVSYAISGDRLYGWNYDWGTASDLYYTPLYTAATEGKTHWKYALEIMGDGYWAEGEEHTDLWSKYHQWSDK
ncbi:MAG: hypothetical protein E7503_01950 [Ruminococcus sp.]|nr:hypothetical protein [Ruminococcus sp.]